MQELVPSPCRDHVVYCKGIAERSGPPLRRRLVRWAKLSRRTPAFLGPDQEQHLEFIDAAAAHMSAYDDNPRAQARAILRMDGADLRTRNEEELATLSSKCLTTWTRAIIRGMKGGTGFKAGNAQRRGCGDNTQDGGLAPPSLVCSFRAKVALERLDARLIAKVSLGWGALAWGVWISG